MTLHEAHIQLLFSYGTLQLEAVQVALFGRPLSGVRDTLAGFELVLFAVKEPEVIAISGKSHHTMARFTGHPSDMIPGTAFSLAKTEIENADKYEVAPLGRVSVVLQSGAQAWAYVDAQYALLTK